MEPVITDDKSGKVPLAQINDKVCHIVDERLYNGQQLTDVVGGLGIEVNGYNYYFYLQDVINFCLSVSGSI